MLCASTRRLAIVARRFDMRTRSSVRVPKAGGVSALGTDGRAAAGGGAGGRSGAAAGAACAGAAGVAAIIQPGGSRRDDEVIAACNEHGLPMIFTGRRHFKH